MRYPQSHTCFNAIVIPEELINNDTPDASKQFIVKMLEACLGSNDFGNA